MQPYNRPLGVAKHHNGNLATRQILLVMDVLVRTEKNLVSCLLGPLNEFAVSQLVPTGLPRIANLVAGKAGGNRFRGALLCSRVMRADTRNPETAPFPKNIRPDFRRSHLS